MHDSRLRQWAPGLILAAALCAVLGALLAPVAPGREPWQDEVDAQRLRSLSELSGRVTRSELDAAWAIVDPAGLLETVVSVDDERVTARFALPREEVTVDIGLRQAGPPEAPRGSPDRRSQPQALDGLRVLLDPGHHGGAWSAEEMRHLEVSEGSVTGVVREGDLTYAAAALLRERLEGAGAVVRVTRPEPPERSFPDGAAESYDPEVEAALTLARRLRWPSVQPWFSLYPTRLAHMMLTSLRHRMARSIDHSDYTAFDLRRRAALAQQWGADVTLSLHFNMARNRTTNGIVAFVSGNVLVGEVDTAADQYYAVRRLLDGSLPVSIALGTAIGYAMQRHFDLPALGESVSPLVGFTHKLAIDVDAGLYARNLAIVRRAQGPVLLLEGPCMNHRNEASRLLREDVWVEGKAYPDRVQQYSDAVFDALQSHAHLLH